MRLDLIFPCYFKLIQLLSYFGTGFQFSGLISERATPVLIPNTEVKPFSADGTARAAVWESRTRPGFILKRLQQMLRAFFFALYPTLPDICLRLIFSDKHKPLKNLA